MSTEAPGRLHASDFTALIFDLGGVLLPLAPERTWLALSELFGTDTQERVEQTARGALFERYERGELRSSEFHEELRAALSPVGVASLKPPSPSAEQINQAWCAMLGEITEGTLDLLQGLGRRKRIFLLSNTNEVHYDHFLDQYEGRHGSKYGSFESLFETAHTSHRMGARKPEPRIFQRLIGQHGLDPSTTLFLDDTWENIQAARRVGLCAEHHPTNHPIFERLRAE